MNMRIAPVSAAVMQQTTDWTTLPSGAIDDGDYEFLRKLVYERSRINLGPDKRALVSARIAKRLRALKIGSCREYCLRLKSPEGEEELGHFVDAMSTNHTNFFREEKHFQWLQSVPLPEWRASRPQRELRVWSAASSSGEEPYTIAIVLAEFFGGMEGWRIDASDISTRVLAKAEQGIYDQERVAPVRQDLLRKYFQRGVGKWEGHFRVKDSLRERVTFHHLNLFDAHYPFRQPFQVIFCRNVMIYFDRPTQELLVSKLSAQLEPGGYFIVGHSESLSSIRHSLRTLQPTIYRKV